MAFRASELTVITLCKLFVPFFHSYIKMNNYTHVKYVNSVRNPMLFYSVHNPMWCYSVYTCVIKDSNLLVGQC